jgi:hypothetical protein
MVSGRAAADVLRTERAWLRPAQRRRAAAHCVACVCRGGATAPGSLPKLSRSASVPSGAMRPHCRCRPRCRSPCCPASCATAVEEDVWLKVARRARPDFVGQVVRRMGRPPRSPGRGDHAARRRQDVLVRRFVVAEPPAGEVDRACTCAVQLDRVELLRGARAPYRCEHSFTFTWLSTVARAAAWVGQSFARAGGDAGRDHDRERAGADQQRLSRCRRPARR